MIIGHKKQQYFLKKMISSGEIPHALLFTGPEELGKKTIALKMFSSIFKEELMNHPDFSLIEPKTNQIQIAQIRDLNWKLSLKPMKAPLLGAVIDRAHSMTLEAQNCFLKTLEEPKARSLLILITEHPNYLLPTITSRCENLKFYPVRDEEIRVYLDRGKISKDKVKEIVNLSLGRPGEAVNFSKDLEKLEDRKKKIEELEKISNSPFSIRFKYVKELAKKEDLKETINIWLSYFRKKLFSAKDSQNLIRIKNILNSIQETAFVISTTNINPRLALEILVMKL